MIIILPFFGATSTSKFLKVFMMTCYCGITFLEEQLTGLHQNLFHPNEVD